MWLLRQTGQRTCHYALWRSMGVNIQQQLHAAFALSRVSESMYTLHCAAIRAKWSTIKCLSLYVHASMRLYVLDCTRHCRAARGNRLIIDSKLKPRLRYCLLRRESGISSMCLECNRTFRFPLTFNLANEHRVLRTRQMQRISTVRRNNNSETHRMRRERYFRGRSAYAFRQTIEAARRRQRWWWWWWQRQFSSWSDPLDPLLQPVSEGFHFRDATLRLPAYGKGTSRVGKVPTIWNTSK